MIKYQGEFLCCNEFITPIYCESALLLWSFCCTYQPNIGMSCPLPVPVGLSFMYTTALRVSSRYFCDVKRYVFASSCQTDFTATDIPALLQKACTHFAVLDHLLRYLARRNLDLLPRRHYQLANCIYLATVWTLSSLVLLHAAGALFAASLFAKNCR